LTRDHNTILTQKGQGKGSSTKTVTFPVDQGTDRRRERDTEGNSGKLTADGGIGPSVTAIANFVREKKQI